MIKVGIIGVGFMGKMHFGVYRNCSDARVGALCDLDPKRARGDLSDMWSNLATAGESQLPMEGIASFTDYRELLRDPSIDLIDICVPTPAHAALAVDALKAGKHVLCEKPLARTVEQARQIAAAAAASSRCFMPAMCMRFWPQWAWLKAAIAEQRFGRVVSAHFRRLGTTPRGWYRQAANSGGALLDLHIHDTDFVQFLFGLPEAVSSRGYSKTTEGIDHVVTQYQFPRGPLVIAEGGWAMADGWGFRMQYTVNFEQATAEFDLGRAEPLMLYHNGKAEPVPCAVSDGYHGEIRYLLDAIAQGRKPTLVTAEDGVRALTILDAEHRSVLAGGALVKVEHDATAATSQ